MSPKMFIPCTIVLTETEYTILQNMLKVWELEEKDVSLVIRRIIQEWDQAQRPHKNRTPQTKP